VLIRGNGTLKNELSGISNSTLPIDGLDNIINHPKRGVL
jgi:hypothetical protein